MLPVLACVVPLAANASASAGGRQAAVVRVVRSGFSNEVSRSEYFPTCGVELRNVSRRDARNVVVTATWINAHGRPLGAVRSDLALIPARRTFYLGCSQTDGLATPVASVRVGVKVDRSTPGTGALPVVTNLRLRRGSCIGRTARRRFSSAKCDAPTLSGRVANRYATRFSPDATIYAVFFDDQGRIVGGESDDTTAASLKPGAAVRFLLSSVGSGVASARVSVDPCGVDAFIGQCRVP